MESDLTAHEIVGQLASAVSGNSEQEKKAAFARIKEESRNVDFSNKVDADDLTLLIRVFSRLEELDEQLILTATLCNIIFINDQLSKGEVTAVLCEELIPTLVRLLSSVGEREIYTDGQYQSYLPIFRLYFLLSYNKNLLPELRDSMPKISGKLLNFISLCELETHSLNKVIVEILKIMYSYIHQEGNTNGLDSAFVLSCNKFNLLYGSIKQSNQEYDEILHHFGNILVSISTDVSKNYMLNKKTFALNEIRLLNALTADQLSPVIPSSNLLVLTVLVDIDSEEKDDTVSQCIKQNLDFQHLERLGSKDPNVVAIIHDLKTNLNIPTDLTNDVINNLNPHPEQTETNPALDDMTEDEKERELDKINSIFEKIEKNGVFKIETQN